MNKSGLLVITQKMDMNDPVLGFFHEWVNEFSKKYERVSVICLQKGQYRLPDNVTVYSLGKEKDTSKIKYIFRFLKQIFYLKDEYSKVFVHMNPIYVILGGLFWRFTNKKIALWYTHKNVDLKLKIAELLVDVIFSASEKSFRGNKKKLRIMGHGIDTKRFSPEEDRDIRRRVISVGRISTIKNYEPLIDSLKILKDQGVEDIRVSIAGGSAVAKDDYYFNHLVKLVKHKGLENNIFFIGPVSYKNISQFYNTGNIFINLSKTGSLDKAILEAMSCGLNVITSNEAMFSILPKKYLVSNNPQDIAKKIRNVADQKIDIWARKYVIDNHSLPCLVEKIFLEYESIK